MGRIMFLIISMRTMKGIRGAGVPKGTRWARNWIVLLKILKIMKPSQRGSARESVIARCLVEVKEKDTKPNVLLKIIKANKETNNRMFNFLDFSNTENSLTILWKIIFKVRLEGEVFIQ